MPQKTRPVIALIAFTGLDDVMLESPIIPVYDFLCFLPYWERREREAAALTKARSSS